MLLSRSLPPHFLLPAWATRQLLRALDRAHSSTASKPQTSSKPLLRTQQDRDIDTTCHGQHKSWNVSSKGGSIKKPLESTESTASQINDHEAHTSRDITPGQNVENGGESVPSRKPVKESKFSTFFDQKPNIRFHVSKKGSINKGPQALGVTSNREPDPEEGMIGPMPMTWGSSKYAPGDEKSARSTPNTSMNDRVKSIGVEQQTPSRSLPEAQQPQRTRGLRHGSKLKQRSLDGRQNKETAMQPEQKEPKAFSTDDDKCLRTTSKTWPNQSKSKRSLFDELFPEESEAAKQSEKKFVDKLPAFEWHDASELDWKDTAEKAAKSKRHWIDEVALATPNPTSVEKMAPPAAQQTKSELGLLLLKCASKTLEESDFFRLGSKGQHIEGWTSGILKVIQGRDALNLERLGQYYLVFSSESAALAYLDNTIRLHRLSKVHGHSVSTFPFPSRFLRSGEDIKQVLRGYSLVPGQSKLSLRLINRPYSPKLVQLLTGGGPAAIATQKTQSQDMVLFSVDRGQISHYDLRHAISMDGKRRNLHWGLKTGGDNAIVRVNDDHQSGSNHDAVEAATKHQPRRNMWGPARYILSFKDTHEARRFVREWHRRPFPVQKEQKVGNEPPPIMNAELFW